MDHHPTQPFPEETHDHPIPSIGSTLTTFAILVALTIGALVVGFSDLGPWKVVASLAVACVQAGVLAVYFMDLRAADRLTWLIAAASIFWTGLMFLFILTDFLTRHLAVY